MQCVTVERRAAHAWLHSKAVDAVDKAFVQERLHLLNHSEWDADLECQLRCAPA